MLIRSNAHLAGEMSAQEERYWIHALSGDPLIGNFLKQQGAFVDPRKRAMNQPVCERCEKLAFWHKEGVQCPSCGHWAPVRMHKVKEHIRDGLFK